MQNRQLQFSTKQFDVVVIGAGMFGACVAWDAALQGYSVAVIDKGDFASATSSNHLKFIHGGIRYLQHLDLLRLWESCRERSALLRIAPHLTYPVPIVFPTYGYGRRSKALMRAAMFAYDCLTPNRNRGILDPARKVPNGTTISRADVLDVFPGIPDASLTGAAVFHDAQMYNPARLVLAFLKSAVSKGAVIANYVTADRLIYEDDRVKGCVATDGLSGEKMEIFGQVVINAAGPWAHRLLKDGLGLNLDPKPSFSRDLAFVVNKSISKSHAVGCQIGSGDSDAVLDRGGRHLFLVPWRNRTLVGVWHRYTENHPDEIAVSRDELESYLNEVNGVYNGLNLQYEDIGIVNTGLILFGSKQEQGGANGHSFAKRSLLIDHAEDGVDGLITIIGVRATVARGEAEEVGKLIRAKLKQSRVDANTRWEGLAGGEFDNFESLVDEIKDALPTGDKDLATALAHNYGSEYKNVLECASEKSHLLPIGQTRVLAAEAIHAARFEWAKSLDDIVLRRTELASAGDPGGDAVEQVAQLVAPYFGWDDEEAAEQVRATRMVLENRGPWNIVDRFEQDQVV